jgi:hypothetical protein
VKERFTSPLDGRVRSGFGGGRSHKSKVIAGTLVLGLVPFLFSTFAASVTVGTGALEFGQGSQQAVACDETVYAAVSQEWFSQPTSEDSSAGFFRVKSVTISDLDLLSCKGKKLRIRLIDTQGAEMSIGPNVDVKVLQIVVPDTDAPVSTGDPIELQLASLASDGTPISDQLAASVSLNVSGTSIYDGADLSINAADVTFYLDPSATYVTLDGQNVGRVTVETVNNPARR